MKNHGKTSAPTKAAAATPSKVTKPAQSAKSAKPKVTPAKTPASAGRVRVKKLEEEDDGAPGNELGDPESPSVGRKRSRTAEVDGGLDKKVKTEVFDDYDDVYGHEHFFPAEEGGAQMEI